MKNFYIKVNNTGLTLVVALMATNVLNLFLNAILGRYLSFADFGLLTFFNSLYYLINIFLLSLIATVNHRIAYLNAEGNVVEGQLLYLRTTKNLLIIAIVASLLWLILSPFMHSFFNAGTALPFLLFTPIILFGPFLSLNKGILLGNFLFTLVGVVIVSEAVGKILAALTFLHFGLNHLIYLAIPISVVISFIISFFYTKKYLKIEQKGKGSFPKKFFLATVLTTISSTAFLSVDVILVKHYLSPNMAGEYALLALVGKIIYFFGTIFNSLLISFISRDEGYKRPLNNTFLWFLLLCTILTIAIFTVVGPLGSFILPIVFGQKIRMITPYLIPYSLGIALFTIISTFTTFYLARHIYLFAVLAILETVSMMAGISAFHGSIMQVTYSILFVNIATFVIVLLLHTNQTVLYQLNGKLAFRKNF